VTQVTLTFSDGVEHELAVEPGQSVLDAGLAAGLPLLYQCRSGSCSSCLARLVEGRAEHRPGSASSLSPSEKAEGLRLLCMTEPEAGCRFALSYDSHAGEARPVKAQCFVNAVERIAADVMRLELELADGDWLDFRPGQFINVRVPGTETVRSYSMATTVERLPRIELLIRLLPGGVMSDWLLNRAKVDDVVEIEGPFGAFS
jgi:benzoate/toluate 1,2-dioxygenase reductase subunit